MINSRHFQRLEHIYEAASTEAYTRDEVAVAMGHARVAAKLHPDRLSTQDVANHTHYRDLLVDAASLAAGSLVEDRMVGTEQFEMQVVESDYTGPVRATARVILAQPPRYRVEVELVSPSGDVLARGTGVFAPTSQDLPPDPAPDQETAHASKPSPAVYASVWSTPFGVLHLN